jgi:hypothetical protein
MHNRNAKIPEKRYETDIKGVRRGQYHLPFFEPVAGANGIVFYTWAADRTQTFRTFDRGCFWEIRGSGKSFEKLESQQSASVRLRSF